jgi:predicted secreted hydrolase
VDLTTGTGTTADTTSWSRASDSVGVVLKVCSRPVWDSTNGVFYAMEREITIDSCGLMISISAETRVNVDTAEDCA